MDKWELFDLRDPANGPEEFPSIVINSDEKLREELKRLARLQPAIIVIQGPPRQTLQIGIGGPMGGVRWYGEQNSRGGGHALADREWFSDRIDYLSEGDYISFWPDQLMPVERAIEIVSYFYRHHKLPEWVVWKNWNNDTKNWDIVPATSQPPRFPAIVEEPSIQTKEPAT